MSEYLKPELKKHETLKQVTFSSHYGPDDNPDPSDNDHSRNGHSNETIPALPHEFTTTFPSANPAAGGGLYHGVSVSEEKIN